MRRLLFVLAIPVFILSCTDKDKVPKDILAKQKMQAVLWDMIKAGEFLEGFVFNRDTTIEKNAEARAWFDSVYAMHHITKAEFDKSYAWYRNHPAVMKTILDSLAKKPEPPARLPGQAALPGPATPIDSSLKRQKRVPGKSRFLQQLSDSSKRRLIPR